MVAGSKGSPGFDLKTAHRKRRVIQIGFAAAAVAVLAVALVLYLAMPGDKSSTLNAGKAVRVTSSKLVTKPGSDEPKAVLSITKTSYARTAGRSNTSSAPRSSI